MWTQDFNCCYSTITFLDNYLIYFLNIQLRYLSNYRSGLECLINNKPPTVVNYVKKEIFHVASLYLLLCSMINSPSTTWCTEHVY